MENIETLYPLSPMQQGMLFHTLYAAPESGMYFNQLSFTLHGDDLNTKAFQEAWQFVLERHVALRTAFQWKELEEPMQVVYKQVKLPWEQLDWRMLSSAEQQNKLEHFLKADYTRDFALEQAPLMRCALIQLTNKSYHFVWTHHHLLIDGWCVPIIFKDVFAYYEAKCQSVKLQLPPPRPYQKYIAWLQEQDMAEAEQFWREQLKGVLAPTTLNLETVGTTAYQEAFQVKKSIELSPATTEALQTLAKQHSLTLNTLVQGAWALLLSHYSGEEDVVFGVTVSGRQMPLPGVESMVGLFINTLPVRVFLSGEQTLIPWLQQLQAQQVEREPYSYTPLVEIHRWSDIPPGTALFESIFVFENYPFDESLLKSNNQLTLSNFQNIEKTNYPIGIMGIPGSKLSLTLIYDPGRFEASIIERMLGHLQTLLESMAAEPQQKLMEIELLTESERHQLLVEWNQTQTAYPQDQGIHQLFEAQVDKTPEAIAVVFEDQQLTYQALNTRANQLAHYLQTLGVKPEVLVGICVERSLEMIIGLLGILKAGGAYVPFDPNYPQERLVFMLEDSKVLLLLTQQKLMAQLPDSKAQVICLDNDWGMISKARSENVNSGVCSDNLAYVMYTSGSTGKPKGVMIEHHNVLAMLHGFEHVAPSIQALIGTSVCPFSFDVSVWEFFSNLCFGGTLHLISPELLTHPESFVRYLVEHHITCTYIPPALLSDVAAQLEKWGTQIKLNRILVGVEPIEQGILQRFRHLSKRLHIVNGYGPTETTICATFFSFMTAKDLSRRTPIGRGVQGYEVHLMNPHLQLVPIGVIGEIVIGGAGIGRGYLNLPDLTAEKFIPNPFGEIGSRLYKTGDLARYLPDGNIEFLGRIDNQVKLRGFRIELAEIESALTQHPNIRETVVVAREDQPGNKRLVAYIVSDLIPERIPYQVDCLLRREESKILKLRTEDISSGGVLLGGTVPLEKDQAISLRLRLPGESEACWLEGKVAWSQSHCAGIQFKLTQEEQTQLEKSITYLLETQGLLKVLQRILTENLRNYLKEKLPDYMVPANFVLLNALPLTPNGKVDRRALPVPEMVYLSKEASLPQTQLELMMAKVWQDVLHLNKVGIHDNFFELGGHSLLLPQLQSKLQDKLGKDISMLELFEYPTIQAFAQHFSQTHQCVSAPVQQRPETRTRQASHDIAIIGMAGRFPGAPDLEAFWHNLREGVESITFFSDEELISAGIDTATLNHPHYVKANGVLSDVEWFDAAFFDFNPKDAEVTDPQHRLFLECAVEALDNAGIAPDTDEYSVGVYAGVGMNTYLFNNLSQNLDQLSESVGTYQLLIENDKDFLPTRTSYKLNLKGPSVNIQTACSTSLVAVHLACRSLLDGECDVALAGGIAIHVPQQVGYWYQEGMISSPDGHCRAFDAQAQGTVGGSGVGIVVLKRLDEAIADGDNIQAVIKGSAINNDGSLKVGYTAPSVEGQAAVISKAQANAGIEAESLSYIEAHGTGTALGDPIEIAALTKAFQASTQKKAFCAIGSVKTNIGHTDAASGVAGLIKTVQALKHRLLPPSLHFEQPNPQIDFANSPFYVNTTLSEWQPIDGMPRRAAVSSFGIGGTNAHVILEESPTVEPSGESRPWQLLLLSAKTDSALDLITANLAAYIEQHPEKKLADVAYTLSTGRKAFKHRRMLVCQNAEQATTALRTLDPSCVLTHFQEPQNRPIVFMFSGQGAQYVNMGWELYQTEPIFQEQVDKCSEYLKPFLGRDLRLVLYPELLYSPFSKGVIQTAERAISEQEATELLTHTAIAQPALFVIEYALAQLWMAWGVHPEAMIGHSIGEYVAACLSEVFSLEEALSLVALRGKMMQEMPDGAMLSVPLAEKEVQPLLSKGLSLAAVNTPSVCVVSGPTEAIAVLQTQLTEQNVACRRLHTSHAFHSDMMTPLLGRFTEQVKQVELCVPKIPYLSNLTGTWITDKEATNPNYWGRHLRYTVLFAEGLQHLLQEPARILIEIGPGRTLTTLARQHADCKAEQVVLSSLRHPEQDNLSDVAFLLNSLGQFWMAGGQVNWLRFYKPERRRRVALPSYPFERQRYWIEPPKQAKAPLPLLQSVVEAAQQQAQQGLSTLDNPIFLEKKSSLERLCVAYMGKALTDLGAFNTPDEKYALEPLFKQFNVQPRYQQLLARWMSVLVEQGQLQQVGENFTHLERITTEAFQALVEDAQRKWADEPHWVERVQRCGDKLAAFLTGESQATEVLFDQETRASTTDESEITALVQESPLMQYYNRIMQTTVQQVVTLLPPSIKLNMLEMGGGSGYATSVILPVLPAQQTRYTFTDISRLLVELAKQKFSPYPFVEYGVLDIEQSPQQQGYEPHRFDMVVAVNMLHVTRNIAETLAHVRSLLAPNGLLLIWEVTQPQLDFDITDGLLMKPVEEGDRNQGNPFLSQEQWHQALLAQGFVEVAAFPKTDVIGHHILVAQADASGAPAQAAFTKLLEAHQAEPIKTTPVSLGKQPDTADWFYMPSWKQKQLSTPVGNSASESTTVVFHDEAVGLGKQLVQRLEHQGQEVISVTIGTSFTQICENHYTLNPKQADDYEALVKALQARDKPFKTLVHFWTVTPEYTESRLEALEQAQTLGFYSLFFLAQAFGKQNVTDALEIAVVSNNIQQVTGQEMSLCPEKATVIGPVRVIPTEYPNIRCCSIDVVLPESGSPLEEKLIAQLLHELSTPSDDQMIAYRGHHRWVQTFDPFRLEAVNKTPRLREGGVYLITGGLGGIGLVLAEHLAKTVAAKLILIGRSAFPEREDWSQWLATHETEDTISLKIQKIQALEELGAEVLVVSADVTDLQKMQAVITQASERFGQIHGVIHAAGVSPGGTIQRKTPEQADSILAPKVLGTLVLDAVLKDFNLDCFVLCSSLASILGNLGSVDHCGANAFIDAFAHYKTTQLNQFTISINWDGWQEVGQAAEAAKQEYDGRTLLSQTLQEKAVSHPLFDKCIIEGSEEHYVTHRAKKHWLLDEHRILGEATLPGTGYLEMARAAFEENHPNLGTLEIREVYFLTPLTVKENEDVEVRTILKPQEHGFEFVIVSQSDSNKAEWREHARGEIISREAKAPPTQYDLQNLEESCREKEMIFTGGELEKQDRFVKVGHRWHNMKWLKFSQHEGLCLLELPADYASDVNTFKLHPALMDNATGFAGAKNEGDFLPFSYKKLVIKGPLPAKIYSYITSDADNASQTDTPKFNITIMDEQGTGLVEIEDYTLRRIAVEKLEKSLEQSQPVSDNFYLDIVSPGLLDSLTFMPATRQRPGPGEVEIEVYATGINFKEVLIALGVISVPTDMPVKFGYECVGKIVAIGEGVDGFQIGDAVIAFTPNGFGAFTTTLASSVIIKPDSLSFEEAATIPIAFGTAYYALIKLARLAEGERILIHAAAGGVGMAAVKIAQWMGAEIFATAGNPEKRAFLRSLGIAYVMDSRSLDFASEVMAYTEGKGVDVVLNSLGGEFISKSFETLAPFGRFVELGIRDIYNNTQLGLRPFERGLAYFAVGAGQEIPHFQAQFREIVQHFNAAHFTPLPHHVFPITEVANAFEYMAKAKHIGKVVVSLQDKEAVLKQVSERPTVDTPVRRIGPSAGLPNKPEPVKNLFYKNISEYLLPAEGVEVFRRILGSTLHQVLVSTRDLQSRLEENQATTFLSELKVSEPVHSPAHPRPQLSHAYVAPRNALEQKLANLWQQFMGIEQVGIHDDFFELGGDSLLAIQVIAKLRKTLEIELSPHSLLNSPTIAALAKLLEETLPKQSDQPQEALSPLLVDIQTGNRLKTPLFLMHPVGGHVYFYRNLANQMGTEQPIYGLQAQGMDEKTELLTQVEEMATLYIEALRVRQPQGPYFLGGSSFGGLLAFEMAQQLHALGQQIALLAMIDTPVLDQMPVKLETDVEILAYMLNVGGNVALPLDELQKLEPDEQLRYFLEEQRKIENQMLFDLDIPQLRHFLKMFKVNNQAMWDYQPRVYPGKITFFSAQEKDPYNAKTPERAWQLLAGEIEVIDVPGNHITMNTTPHVQIIADRLKAALEQ